MNLEVFFVIYNYNLLISNVNVILNSVCVCENYRFTDTFNFVL